MVDIPEQAVKAAIAVIRAHDNEAWGEDCGDEPYVDLVTRMLTAAAPYMSGVDVKRLRWREKDSGAYAHCAVGYYEIKETRLGFCVYRNTFLVSKDMFETLEAAKVAAQDNLERRLLVCLSVKPVDVAAVRRQALEEAAQALDHEATVNAVRSETCSDDMVDEFCDRAEFFKEAADLVRALKSQPLAREQALEAHSDLLERLDRGVVQIGLHEDNDTELFDVETACETMSEAAAAIRALSYPDHADVTPSSGCVFTDMGVERPAPDHAEAGKVEGDGWTVEYEVYSEDEWQAGSFDLAGALVYAEMYVLDGMENITIQEVRRRTLPASEGAE